jgi:hypothetical protein
MFLGVLANNRKREIFVNGKKTKSKVDELKKGLFWHDSA